MVLIAVGVGTASALVTITLAGDVIITDNLTVDTDTLTVDSATNRVGIGMTAPSSTLDVNGDISFPIGVDRTIGMPQVNSGNHKDLIVQAGGNAASWGSAVRGGNLVLKAGDANQSGPGNPTSTSRDNNVKIYAGDNVFDGVESTLHNGDIQFFAGNGQPERMRLVGNTGNVGIGTTNPKLDLHVAGSVLVDGFIFADGLKANQIVQKRYVLADVKSIGGLTATTVSTLCQNDDVVITGGYEMQKTTLFGDQMKVLANGPISTPVQGWGVQFLNGVTVTLTATVAVTCLDTNGNFNNSIYPLQDGTALLWES